MHKPEEVLLHFSLGKGGFFLPLLKKGGGREEKGRENGESNIENKHGKKMEVHTTKTKKKGKGGKTT